MAREHAVSQLRLQAGSGRRRVRQNVFGWPGSTQSGDCAYRLDPDVGAFARTRSGGPGARSLATAPTADSGRRRVRQNAFGGPGSTQSGDCAYRLAPGVGAFARTRSGICATAVAGILKWVEMEKGLHVGAWRTATDTGPTNRAAEHNPVSSGLSTPPIAIGPIRTLSPGAKKMPHPLNGGEALG